VPCDGRSTPTSRVYISFHRESAQAKLMTTTMNFLSQPPYDVLWQFAICAALFHLVAMKLPQQADSALNVIPSSAGALILFAFFLYWRAIPFTEALYLYLWFNVLFVRLSSALLTTVFAGHHPANDIQYIFPTSSDSWVHLVYGHRYNICHEYRRTERVFQDKWTSETAKASVAGISVDQGGREVLYSRLESPVRKVICIALAILSTIRSLYSWKFASPDRLCIDQRNFGGWPTPSALSAKIHLTSHKSRITAESFADQPSPPKMSDDHCTTTIKAELLRRYIH